MICKSHRLVPPRPCFQQHRAFLASDQSKSLSHCRLELNKHKRQEWEHEALNRRTQHASGIADEGPPPGDGI